MILCFMTAALAFKATTVAATAFAGLAAGAAASLGLIRDSPPDAMAQLIAALVTALTIMKFGTIALAIVAYRFGSCAEV